MILCQSRPSHATSERASLDMLADISDMSGGVGFAGLNHVDINVRKCQLIFNER